MARLFLDVLNLSITAGWLIAAVMLVRLVIRKRAPKWICCLMWGMVGLRLILPFSLESAFSLVPSRETVIPESVYGEVARPVTPPDNIPDAPVITPEVSENDIPDMPVINTYPEEYIHSGIGIIDNKVNPIIQSTATVTENGKETNALQTVMEAASIIWICGMAVLCIYAVINYLLLKKRISFSVPEGKDIRKSEAVGSPFILGFFRPRIYLPFGLSAETEAHVIAHERAHLKRKDHWIKPIGYAVLTLHWFNPLVWAAYILLCRDIEYACDEKVVKNMSAKARKAYAEALLECGVSRSMIAACPVAFGEIGVKTRVKNALNYKKPLFWVMILAVVICAAVAVLFLTSPAAKDNETSENVSENVSEEVSETSKDEIIKIIPPALGDTDPLDFNLWYGPEDVIAKHITLDERIEAIKRSESKVAFCIVELTELNFVENENDYSNSYVDLKFRIVKTIAKSSSWDLEENQEISSFQQFVYWKDVDGVTEVRYTEDFPPPFLVCGSYYGVTINDGQVPKDSPEGYDVSVTNLTIPLNDKSINDTEYRNKLYKELQMALGNQGGYYENCETIIDRYFEKTLIPPPETSEDEVSEPDVSKTEILALLKQDIAKAKAVLEKGYSVKHNDDEIKFYEKDNSIGLKNSVVIFAYKDGKMQISCKSDDKYNVFEIRNTTVDDIYPYIETTLDSIEASIRTVIDTLNNEKVRITHSDNTYYFSGECTYNSAEATASGRISFTANDMYIKCTYTYKDKNNKTQNSVIEYTIRANDQTVNYDLDILRKLEFETPEQLKAYYKKVNDAFDSVLNLAKYPLNKYITSEEKSFDSEGTNEYRTLRLIAVGTNTDYEAAEFLEFDTIGGDIYYSKSYTYTTENGYEKRRIYKANGYNTPDRKPVNKDETTAKEQKETFAERFAYNFIFSSQNFYSNYGYGLSNNLPDVVHETLNVMFRLNQLNDINFSDNADGTITAEFTASPNWLGVLLFTEAGDGLYEWVNTVNNDPDLNQKVTLTYDPITKQMTAYEFLCEAKGTDGFWFKHSCVVTVTEAHESMLPDKADLLAGNWE